MAQIRPFKGLRYSAEAGLLESLVAPPYDVLSKSERDDYAAKNEHNIVLLTLPEEHSDDRSKFVKYARSSSRLAEWRRDGTLELESKPTFYRYTQSFTIPGEAGTLVRSAIIALLKVEPYEKGVVLPHEQTFPKHKEDRLRILEATRTHLECIYGLFEDQDGSIQDVISSAPVTHAGDFTSAEGVRQQIDLIQDEDTIAKLCLMLEDKKVWIADGHHRYETACNFRNMQGEKSGLIPEDFMMMALSSMADPGLVILPTHRIVPELPLKGEDLATKLSEYFDVSRVPNENLLDELKRLESSSTRVLGIALPGSDGLLLKLNPASKALEWIEGSESERLKLLDVTLLHKIIFEKVLGLSGLDFFSYTRDPEEALQAVRNGADGAFLMNPPSVEDMRLIALGGEKMPQKSTYYYPKLLSGLVLWQLEDF